MTCDCRLVNRWCFNPAKFLLVQGENTSPICKTCKKRYDSSLNYFVRINILIFEDEEIIGDKS